MATASVKSCESCRFNPDRDFDYNCGGSCDGCKDYSNYKPEKRYDKGLCVKCIYDEDPCHYECVECQDGRNYCPKPTQIEAVEDKIWTLSQEVLSLRFELIRLKQNQGEH